jgi:NADH-quinone oxidoreductase subunit G
MCIIEIEGVNKPVTGCTTMISDNISIYTHSKMVRKARQAILEFLLLNHPLDCPVCDQGGECDLQEETLTYGPDRSRYLSKKNQLMIFKWGIN